MRDKYPILAVQLRSHMSSECAEHLIGMFMSVMMAPEVKEIIPPLASFIHCSHLSTSNPLLHQRQERIKKKTNRQKRDQKRKTHRALVKDDAPLRVQADRQQRGHRLPPAPPQHLAAPRPDLLVVVVPRRRRERVQVDDGEEELGARRARVLEADPLPQGAEVVAQVRRAGGLDAREDDGFPLVSVVNLVVVVVVSRSG